MYCIYIVYERNAGINIIMDLVWLVMVRFAGLNACVVYVLRSNYVCW